MSPIRGGTDGRCPLKRGDAGLAVRAADPLDSSVAIGMPVKLEDESAAVAVAQLLGDHPWLKLEVVEHVARAEVSQLVEIELILFVGGDTLAQMMPGRQARGECAANRDPGSPGSSALVARARSG